MTFHLNWFGRIIRFCAYELKTFELEEYRRWKRDPKNFKPYTGR